MGCTHKILKLTRNMRAQISGDEKTQEFAKSIFQIEGTMTDKDEIVNFPTEFLIH